MTTETCNNILDVSSHDIISPLPTTTSAPLLLSPEIISITTSPPPPLLLDNNQQVNTSSIIGVVAVDDYIHDDSYENTLSSTSSTNNDQTTTSNVGTSTSGSRSTFSNSFTFDNPSDSLSFLTTSSNVGSRYHKYNRKHHISHQILPSKLHHEQCKLVKRDFSGACAVFLVRFRNDLDDDHDFVQRRVDLDVDQFEFINNHGGADEEPTTTTIAEQQQLPALDNQDNNNTVDTLLTLKDILIDKNQVNRLERREDTSSISNNSNDDDDIITNNTNSSTNHSWIHSSNPLFEEEEFEFVNPLLLSCENDIPNHLLMFYHTCHYETVSSTTTTTSQIVSHLDSLTPADKWTEIINPLSLSGLCRTQTAQRELQQFMKHKITKLKDPLMTTTSTFSITKKSEKRKSKRASGAFKRMSIVKQQPPPPINTSNASNAASTNNGANSSTNNNNYNPVTSTLTSREWQASLLEEEFRINVHLETEFEEFCNPLFEHETHNFLLADGLKFFDLCKLVNDIKTECPPVVNKIIYTRSSSNNNNNNMGEGEGAEDINIKQKLNKILSLGLSTQHQPQHQHHSRTLSSSGGSSSSGIIPESRRTRRYTQLNQEPERRDTIVEETNVINIEKMKLTVDGESIVNYLKKKAQGYLTNDDIIELLSFILDTQRRNINGCRDISNNLVLLTPVPYNAYEYLEFSPNTIYRYVDNDNPVFYNGQILNIIPEKKKATIVSESELLSKLFHKGSVSSGNLAVDSIVPNDGSSSCFLVDPPTYTIKLLIILENLMAIIQKEYFIISDNAIDYYSFKQSENYKLTLRYSSMLRNFDPIKLDRNQKKSFFINLYNLMLLHTFCEKKYIAIEEEYEKFHREPSYLLGRYKISMSDIVNYILREEPLPEWKYYLRDYQLNFLEQQYCYDSTTTTTTCAFSFDPRIHFIMSDGRKSNPLPQAVDQLTIERIIDTSTKRFINDNISFTENSIELPSVFQQYKKDFSPTNGSIFGVLNFIMKHLRKSNQGPFFELLKKSNLSESQLEYYANMPVSQPYNFNNFPILSFQVNFTPVDYSSNCLMFEQFVGNDNSKPITFEEILRNTNYRAQLCTFSEIECSTENIEFYDHVEKYKTITDMEERWKFAHKMYEKFLVSDSPSEVNVNKRLISTAARQIFRTKGEDETYVKLPLDLFDRLNKEVEMVLFDTYSRFTNTEAYQNLVASSRRKTAANASMASGSGGTSFLLSNKSKFSESLFDLINNAANTPNSSMSSTSLDSDLSPFANLLLPNNSSSSPTSTTSNNSSTTSPRLSDRKMSKIGLLAQVFERPEESSIATSAQIKPSALSSVSPRLQSLMEVFSNNNGMDSSNSNSSRRLSNASNDSSISTTSSTSSSRQ